MWNFIFIYDFFWTVTIIEIIAKSIHNQTELFWPDRNRTQDPTVESLILSQLS